MFRLEQEIKTLSAEVEDLEKRAAPHPEMPNATWIRAKLGDLAELLKTQMPTAALALRNILGKVVAHPVVQPGKKRGYVQLHFVIHGFEVVQTPIGETLPESVQRAMVAGVGSVQAEAQSFVLDLGEPTNMDRHGPTVVAMRNAKVKWSKIAEITGLQIQNAYTLYKRLTQGVPTQETPPPSV